MVGYLARGTTVNGDVVNFVSYLDGGGFVGISKYLTFVRVELNFVFSLPNLKGVEVALECSEVI